MCIYDAISHQRPLSKRSCGGESDLMPFLVKSWMHAPKSKQRKVIINFWSHSNFSTSPTPLYKVTTKLLIAFLCAFACLFVANYPLYVCRPEKTKRFWLNWIRIPLTVLNRRFSTSSCLLKKGIQVNLRKFKQIQEKTTEIDVWSLFASCARLFFLALAMLCIVLIFLPIF